MLRIRERGTTELFQKSLGSYFFQNLRNGVRVQGSPRYVSYSPGTIEKCFDTTRPGPPFRGGGPLFLVRFTIPSAQGGQGTIFPASAVTLSSTQLAALGYAFKGQSGDFWQDGYTGGFVHSGLPNLVTLEGENISSPTDYNPVVNPDDLSDLGARAYNRLRPKDAVAGLGQSLVEAGEIPSMFKTTGSGLLNLANLADPKSWAKLKGKSGSYHSKWKAIGGSPLGHLMAPREIGNQFLNTTFGWKPFVKDVSDTINLVQNYYDHLRRATQRNDKYQQRRFSEDEILSDEVVYRYSKNKGNPGFVTFYAPAVGTSQCLSSELTVRRQRMTRIWYEGSFRQYRAEFDKSVPMHDQVRSAKQFLTLAGLNISPTLVYKVIPWTWLVDWGVNVGDNIQVANDYLDGSVVSRYMYLMRETYDRYEYTSVHKFPTSSIQIVSYRELRVKRREPAQSNFGFTLPLNGLSLGQSAILVALGLSKR